VNSFEAGTDFPDAWIVWHNCAVDDAWFVRTDSYPAPGGGVSNLRLHTTGFDGSCNWPGAYAVTPAFTAVPGKTYVVRGWSRNASNVGGTSLLFFDASDQQISYTEVQWPLDAWQYHEDPPVQAMAPAGATHLRVRLYLASPGEYADFDLLSITQE